MASPRIITIGFPFRKGSQAFPAPATDDDAIKASIIQIICTGRRERVMRPTFGCNALSYIFENDNDFFRRNVEREVRQALVRWEKRITVDSVTVEPGDEVTAPGQMLITIGYTNLATGKSASVTVAGGQ